MPNVIWPVRSGTGDVMRNELSPKGDRQVLELAQRVKVFQVFEKRFLRGR